MINLRRQIRFPNLSEAEQAKLVRIIDNLLPERRSLVISLDRMLAYMKTLPDGWQRMGL